MWSVSKQNPMWLFVVDADVLMEDLNIGPWFI